MNTRREFLSLSAAIGAAFAVPTAATASTGFPGSRNALKGRLLLEQDETWNVEGFDAVDVHLIHVDLESKVDSCIFQSRSEAVSGRPVRWNLPGWDPHEGPSVSDRVEQILRTASDADFHGDSSKLYVIRLDHPGGTQYHIAHLNERGLTTEDMFWVAPSTVVFG